MDRSTEMVARGRSAYRGEGDGGGGARAGDVAERVSSFAARVEDAAQAATRKMPQKTARRRSNRGSAVMMCEAARPLPTLTRAAAVTCIAAGQSNTRGARGSIASQA